MMYTNDQSKCIDQEIPYIRHDLVENEEDWFEFIEVIYAILCVTRRLYVY